MRRLSALLLVACLAVGGVLLFRLFQVHDQTREWRLSPSPAPEKLVFDGRDYLRGEMLTGDALMTYAPPGAVYLRHTDGGGDLYEPGVNDSSHTTPTGLAVEINGEFIGYSLLGGP